MNSLKDILNQNLEVTPELILFLISIIDLTSLNSTDSKENITALIKKANTGFNTTFPAAVCVFSNFGDFAKENVNSDINVAVVSTCFPNGQSLQKAKFLEIECVNETKVDEVDIVINRGEFLSGNYDFVSNEISEIRKRLPEKHLKVIFETGELKTEANIRKASQLAMHAGADFIKTSTGKMSIGSTPEAVYYMCSEISDHYKLTGNRIGIKPAGGIRNLNDAIKIYKIVNSVLGIKWLTNNLLRIGASSLYDNLITEYNTRF
jgi:deoxyribose-phosphate aldolase